MLSMPKHAQVVRPCNQSLTIEKISGKPMLLVYENLNVVLVKKTTLATPNASRILDLTSISRKNSHLNKAHLSFGECRASVTPDSFTVISRGKFRRGLQIKEAHFISVLTPKLNVRYYKLKHNPNLVNF